jgi:hypothetical protein
MEAHCPFVHPATDAEPCWRLSAVPGGGAQAEEAGGVPARPRGLGADDARGDAVKHGRIVGRCVLPRWALRVARGAGRRAGASCRRPGGLAPVQVLRGRRGRRCVRRWSASSRAARAAL